MRPVAAVFVFAFLAAAPLGAQHQEGPVRFVRYEHGGHTSYGVLQGERIMEIDGDLFVAEESYLVLEARPGALRILA